MSNDPMKMVADLQLSPIKGERSWHFVWGGLIGTGTTVVAAAHNLQMKAEQTTVEQSPTEVVEEPKATVKAPVAPKKAVTVSKNNPVIIDEYKLATLMNVKPGWFSVQRHNRRNAKRFVFDVDTLGGVSRPFVYDKAAVQKWAKEAVKTNFRGFSRKMQSTSGDRIRALAEGTA